MTDRWLTDFKSKIRKSTEAQVLLLRLKEWGYTVRFVLKIPGDASVLGTCNVLTKTISVRLYDNHDLPIGFYEIIRVLAHEYRHAWQYENNKYHSYLTGTSRNVLAIKCEQDACAFAERYIQNFTKSLTPFEYDFTNLIRNNRVKVSHI